MHKKVLMALVSLLASSSVALADDSPSPAKTAEPAEEKPAEEAEKEEEPEEGPVSGGVELVTQYVQRGMTSGPDHDSTALQPWVEVELPLGFVVNYWGSNTTYPSPAVSTVAEDCEENEKQCLVGRPRAFENDLTLWWQLDLAEVNFRIGATYFVFMNARENDLLESNILLSMTPKIGDVDLGDLSIGAETMLEDAPWGNLGDTYLLIRHQRGIAKGFGAALDLGLHGYGRGKGEEALETTEAFNFRHLDVTLYHEADNGLRVRGTFTLGGWDRLGDRQPNTLTWGAGWSF